MNERKRYSELGVKNSQSVAKTKMESKWKTDLNLRLFQNTTVLRGQRTSRVSRGAGRAMEAGGGQGQGEGTARESGQLGPKLREGVVIGA